MKKLLLFLSFITLLSANNFTIKRDTGKVSLSYEKKNDYYLLSNNKKFNDKVKVIITYKNKKSRQNIELKYKLSKCENKYNLYFICEQNHLDLVKLFLDLSNEKNVKTVHPNWISSTIKY